MFGRGGVKEEGENWEDKRRERSSEMEENSLAFKTFMENRVMLGYKPS